MRVKNITGSGTQKKTFGFGRKVAITLAYNAIATIPDDADVIAAARAHSDAGLLQIVEAPIPLIQGRTATPQHILIKVLDPFGSGGDGAVLKLGTEVFELDDDNTIMAGRTQIAIGTSNAVCADNIKAAISANSVLSGLGIVTADVATAGEDDRRIVVEVPAAVDFDSFTASVTGGSKQLVVSEVAATTLVANTDVLTSRKKSER